LYNNNIQTNTHDDDNYISRLHSAAIHRIQYYYNVNCAATTETLQQLRNRILKTIKNTRTHNYGQLFILIRLLINTEAIVDRRRTNNDDFFLDILVVADTNTTLISNNNES